MATTPATRTESQDQSQKLIAPWWHTASLVALFLGLAVGGAFFQRRARAEPGMLQQHPQVVPLYVSLMAMEWGLFVWVWRGGLRKTGTKLRELIGGKWASAKDCSWTAASRSVYGPLGLWPSWRGIAGSGSAMLRQSRLSYHDEDWKFCCGLAFLSAPDSA